MPAVVIKDIPADVHRLLKAEAERNRRSMNQEALTILERRSSPCRRCPRARPVKPKRPFSHRWLMRAMREGRE